MIEQVKKYLVHLQESICSDLELLDGGAVFEKDHWTKKDGNGSALPVLFVMVMSSRRGVLTSQSLKAIKCQSLQPLFDLS